MTPEHALAASVGVPARNHCPVQARARGVVVSRLLCMQKASGSNPDESMFTVPWEARPDLRRIHAEIDDNPAPAGLSGQPSTGNPVGQGCVASSDTLAEWLRRRPAKPVCSARVGSNPTGVDPFLFADLRTISCGVASHCVLSVSGHKSSFSSVVRAFGC